MYLRTFLLAKAREINDSNHVIVKAKEEAQRKVLATAPPCLRERVREQQQQLLLLGPPPPRVELRLGWARRGHEEAAEIRQATLQYVLGARRSCSTSWVRRNWGRQEE